MSAVISGPLTLIVSKLRDIFIFKQLIKGFYVLPVKESRSCFLIGFRNVLFQKGFRVILADRIQLFPDSKAGVQYLVPDILRYNILIMYQNIRHLLGGGAAVVFTGGKDSLSPIDRQHLPRAHIAADTLDISLNDRDLFLTPVLDDLLELPVVLGGVFVERLQLLLHITLHGCHSVMAHITPGGPVPASGGPDILIDLHNTFRIGLPQGAQFFCRQLPVRLHEAVDPGIELLYCFQRINKFRAALLIPLAFHQDIQLSLVEAAGISGIFLRSLRSF